MVDDEDPADTIRYSLDLGQTWYVTHSSSAQRCFFVFQYIRYDFESGSRISNPLFV